MEKTLFNQMKPGYFLHHVTIQSWDIAASLHLYRDVLGMEIVTEFDVPDKKIFLLAAGGKTFIKLFSVKDNFENDGAVKNNPLVHIALGTEDACSSIEKVRDAGFTVTNEPTRVDLKKFQALISFFTGPSGEEIEFFQVLS